MSRGRYKLMTRTFLDKPENHQNAEPFSPEVLRLLQQQIEQALSMIECNLLRPMTKSKRDRYFAQYGSYDFIIGDFAIKKIVR